MARDRRKIVVPLRGICAVGLMRSFTVLALRMGLGESQIITRSKLRAISAWMLGWAQLDNDPEYSRVYAHRQHADRLRSRNGYPEAAILARASGGVYEYTPAPFPLRYIVFIGAKKHLVLGLSSHVGPPQRSNSFATG